MGAAAARPPRSSKKPRAQTMGSSRSKEVPRNLASARNGVCLPVREPAQSRRCGEAASTGPDRYARLPTRKASTSVAGRAALATPPPRRVGTPAPRERRAFDACPPVCTGCLLLASPPRQGREATEGQAIAASSDFFSRFGEGSLQTVLTPIRYAP